MSHELKKNYSAVWVLTGEKYVPWGLASAASLHALHPEWNLVWLVSESAARRAEELIPDFLKNRLEIRVVAESGESDKEASRRLKVQARELVRGDFFQVDADILFARPLEYDWSSVPTMAAAPNRETIGEFREDPNNSWAMGVFFGLGWQWPLKYFNTGLIFWKDTQKSNEFSECWEKFRSESLFKSGYCMDQPAFNRAASEMNCVDVLPAKFNSPVSTLPQHSKNAVAYHFYFSDAMPWAIRCTALNFIAQKVEKKEHCLLDAIHKFQKHPKPFVGWGAHERQYFLAGQWGNYAERKARVAWNHLKIKLIEFIELGQHAVKQK